MASLQSDDLDDVLYEMYKKQVLKHLRSKMSPELLSTLAALKEGGSGSSDCGLRIPNLECFLASMVARKDGDTYAVSGSYLCGLKSRLESMFESFLSKEVISGIADLFALRCSKTPSLHEENEKLVVDLLNYLVQSSCIKTNGSEFLTPSLQRKDVIGNSPKAPAKRPAKGIPMQELYHVEFFEIGNKWCSL